MRCYLGSRAIYRSFFNQNLPVAVLEPGADLTGYAFLVAPALHLVSEALAESLKGFVRNGGVLLVTPPSGVKEESNLVVERRLPGLLAEMCGVEVEEVDSLAPGMSNCIEFQAGLQPLLTLAPPGVELAERRQSEQRLVFVLNHTTRPQTFHLDRGYMNLLDEGSVVSGEVTLEARGCGHF